MLAARKLPADKEEMVKRLREDVHPALGSRERSAGCGLAGSVPAGLRDPRVGLTQINLYYRHNRGEGSEKDKKDQGTRFLVDVNFAALGAFQLDGLIRGKRFDLMIRSRSRLSATSARRSSASSRMRWRSAAPPERWSSRTVEVFPGLSAR